MIKKAFSENREVIESFFWRALQIFGKQGISFIIFILCAKLLLPYEFGIYNYLMTIIFFLVIFGDFGISTSTSKFVAQYDTTDKERLRSVFFNSAIIVFVLFILVTLFILLFGKLLFPDIYIYLVYLLPLLLFAPLTFLYDGVYRGLRKFRKLGLIFLITGLISLVVVYYLVNEYKLLGAIMSQNFLYLILLVALAFGYRNISFKLDKKVMKEIWKYSVVLGLVSLGFFLYTRINVLILGYFGMIEGIAYYELINKILMFLLIPFTILSQVLAPQITILFSKKRFSDVISDYKKYLLFSFVIGIFTAIFIFISFPLVLKYFLVEYNIPLVKTSMNILLFVLITQSFSIVAANGFSVATGHAKLNMYFLWIFGMLNVPFSIILLKMFGFMGIIYSTLLIKATADILFVLYYYFRLKNLNPAER